MQSIFVPPWSRDRAGSGLFFFEFFAQPGAGICPDLVGLARRDAQQRSGLGVAEPREVAELDQFGGLGARRAQPVEGLVQGQQVLRPLRGGDLPFPYLSGAAAAVLETGLAPGG